MLVSAGAKPSALSQSGESLFSSTQRRNFILALLLVLATLALYNPVSRHPFLNFDDDRYVTQNPHVRAGLTWNSVAWAFTTFHEANWHPLTWLSHQLDYQLFQLNPTGHHYTNVLLHSLNAVLLFLILQWTTGLPWRSLMVAALFAVHPVNVESVAWVAERKNLLSMLFFLLALAAYGAYVRKPGVRRYWLVAALFALGLMAKPMVITFPFVLLLWDYWPLKRLGHSTAGPAAAVKPQSLSWLVAEKLPLFALAAASAVITLKAQSQGGAIRSAQYPFGERLANTLVCYGRYVLNAFWPAHLAAFYPHPAGLPGWQIGLASAFLLAVTTLVLVARQRRYLAVGWFWFLGTLVPMIGLVQVGGQAMADRYAYLPYVGLFLMVCWALPESVQQSRRSAQSLAISGGLVLLALMAVTERQISYWSSNVALWSRTVQVTAPNFVAEDNLGGALRAEGRTEDAMVHFRRAAQINPDDPVGNLNLAVYEQQHGSLQKAVERYQLVLRLTNDPELLATAYGNLGSAYRILHDYTRARESYRAAINHMAANPMAWVGLGLVEQSAGTLDQAINDYSQAMALQPTDVGYLLLAQALQKAGRINEGKAAYDHAQALSADLSRAQQKVKELLAP